MNNYITSRDVQRTTFVENLYNSFKKQAHSLLAERKKLVALAKSYIEDGLEEKECVELLMLDGLSRDNAESYVVMAMDSNNSDSDGNEYSYQFEDNSGNILCSHDVGRTINASSENEAWEKAELDIEAAGYGYSKILNVQKI